MPPTTPPVVLPRPRRRLAALAALAGSVLVAGTLTAATPASAAVPTSAQMSSTLVTALNAIRTAHALPKVSISGTLNRASIPHSALMQRYNLLRTQFPGEATPAQRIANAGWVAGATGENLGVITSPSQLTAWQNGLMANPSARALILNRAFVGVGLGVVYDAARRKIWITEDFAQPSTLPANVADANALLTLMNQERAANGRPALRMNSLLQRSAHAHNLYMARYNTMSHQLSGEPFFATRILNAGYNYSTAGENIGWNADTSQAGVLVLQKIMYNEVPPDDGHRQNILNGTFRDVGIDVYFDAAHGKVWLTQDFGSLG